LQSAAEICVQSRISLHPVDPFHEQPDCALQLFSVPRVSHAIAVPLQDGVPLPSPEEEESTRLIPESSSTSAHDVESDAVGARQK
jgi:hypothetical protein